MGQKKTRRAFVGLSAAAIASAAGCMGYTVTEQSELDDLEERTENLSTELAEREERISELETKVGEKDAQVESLVNDTQTLESDLEAARRDAAITLFELGVEYYEYGNGAMADAATLWNQQDYGVAAEMYGRAYARYSDAESAFAEAVAAAEDAGLEGAGVARTNRDICGHYKDEAYDYERAAAAAENGNIDEATSHQNEADVHNESASELSFNSAEVFRARL